MSDSETEDVVPEIDDTESLVDEDEEDEEEEEDDEENENLFVDNIDSWTEETHSAVPAVKDSAARFDVSQLEDYMHKFHPEARAYTYDTMAENMKKENKTLNFLTKFEITSALGYRAVQLNHGAQPMIETDLTDSYQIAKKELETGKLPFIIRRPMADGTFVHVRINELQYIA